MQPTDEELRQSFRDLSMPDRPNIRFHRRGLDDRLMAATEAQRRTAPWFGIAAAVMAAALIGVPAITRSLASHHTAKGHVHAPTTAPIPHKSWKWHPLGLSQWTMLNARDGVAVGQSGAHIFETTSGGHAWRWMGTMKGWTGLTIFHVFSLQDMVSMAAASNGVVHTAISRDGGVAWRYTATKVPGILMTPKHNPNFFTGTFQTAWANADDGAFLVGESGSQQGSHVKVYVTQDGGRQWQPLFGSVPGEGAIDMSSPTRLWLTTSNGRLYTTHLGRGWTRVSLGDQPVLGDPATQFWANGKEGAVLTRMSPGHIAIWTTNDGGRRWSLISIVPATGTAQLYAANSKNWWIWAGAGVSTHGVMPQDPAGTLWRTTNGGITWTTHAGGPQGVPHQGVWLNTADFISSSVGYAAYVSDTTGITTLYRTTDGGVLWASVKPEARIPAKLLIHINGIVVGG